MLCYHLRSPLRDFSHPLFTSFYHKVVPLGLKVHRLVKRFARLSSTAIPIVSLHARIRYAGMSLVKPSWYPAITNGVGDSRYGRERGTESCRDDLMVGDALSHRTESRRDGLIS